MRPNNLFYKSIAIVMAVMLMPHPLVHAEQAADQFEEVQMIKGDVYSVKTKDLQRVSITDPSIADVSDAKPSEVVLIGQAPGHTVLFVWDANGKRTIIVRVVMEDLAVVKARVSTLLEKSGIKGVSVEQNDLEGKVMLVGRVREEKMETVSSIVDGFQGTVINLVKKEELEDLIQIDMQITELSTTLSKELGVAWNESFTFDEDNATYQTGKFPDMFKIGDVTRSTALQAKVNAMITEGKAHILSKPRLVVKNGKEATFLVGGEIPIKTTTSTTGSDVVTENVTFKEYGVSMAMTPEIKGDKVDILLTVEISDIDDARSSGTDVAFITRSAQTQLFLNDKQTIVLAGMIKKRDGLTVKRVPFISKIPVVGMLFKNSKTPSETGETEVVISLTPTIIKEQAATPKPTVVSIPQPVEAPVAVKPEISATDPGARNSDTLPVIAKNAATVQVNVPEDIKPYAEAVQQRISSAIAYPYEAQENGWQGTVKLSLVIRKDGSLRNVYVKETSGYDVFDQDAMSTAQILSPYAPFPTNLVQEEVTVTIPIVYSLDSFLKNVAKRK